MLALAVGVTLALIGWQFPSLASTPGILLAILGTATGEETANRPVESLPPLLPLVVPILLLFALGIAAAFRREGAAVGAVRLLGVSAMPLVAALLVCYGASVIATARAEKRASAALAGVLSGEGKYAAGLIGKPWPGPAPMIPPSP